jgi:hypothetical protein
VTNSVPTPPTDEQLEQLRGRLRAGLEEGELEQLGREAVQRVEEQRAATDTAKDDAEESAARARLIEPPDMPDYEALTELTLEQKAELPARFHLPTFDDVGSPKLWLCAVCWDEGTLTQWPCATASERGAEVFTR